MPDFIHVFPRFLKSLKTPFKKICEWVHFKWSFRLETKGKRCNYRMYIKSTICPAYIFIVDCLSPFYSALYCQRPLWQRCLKFRLWGKFWCILFGEERVSQIAGKRFARGDWRSREHYDWHENKTLNAKHDSEPAIFQTFNVMDVVNGIRTISKGVVANFDNFMKVCS